MLLHYLVKVKIPKNVILQREITKENCIKCITASLKWTRVIMCLKFTYLGCYTAMRIWNDSRHRRLAKTLGASLVRLWRGHYRCYNWPVTRPSEIMCPWWWRKLWTHVLIWMFIYMIHQNILWSLQCILMHVMAILYFALKDEVVFMCIFGISTFTMTNSNTN